MDFELSVRSNHHASLSDVPYVQSYIQKNRYRVEFVTVACCGRSGGMMMRMILVCREASEEHCTAYFYNHFLS